MSRENRTYRRVVTTFWNDPDLRRRGITKDQRLLLLYYFTGPRTNLAGLYWMPLTYAAQETELPLEDVERWTREELAPYVSYDFETCEVLVHRLAFHNIGEELKPRDNRVQPIARNLADAHSAELVRKWFELYPEWPIDPEKLAPVLDSEGARVRGLGKGLTKGLPKGPTKGPPQGARGRGSGKGLGGAKAIAVAGAVAVAVAEAGTETEPGQSNPPTSRSRTARASSAPPREDEGATHGSENHEPLAIARANIVAIHGGTEDDVTIEGHRVGVGIEVNAFRALCDKVPEPPEIIARAIAFLPEVTGLEPPVSLARWAAEDGPAVFEQCIAKAYAAGAQPLGLRLPALPNGEDHRIQDAKRKAREQLAGLRKSMAL